MAWTEEEREQFSHFVNKILYETLDDNDYENTMRKLDVPMNRATKRYQSVCHNGKNYNLSYKDKSFHCFSECQCSYSLLGLVKKVKDCSTTSAMKWICEQNGIEYKFKEEVKRDDNKYDWKKSLNKYLHKSNSENTLNVYDKSILGCFEDIYHQSWVDDGISVETMEKYCIKYYQRNDSIIIPCFNNNGDMIGIRQRFLNPNSECKYMPLELLNGAEYKFPVGQVLYGMNYNAPNISHYKRCVLVEAEKGTLQTDTMFGDENFTVSMYGKSMSLQKAMSILRLDVEEVIIAIDFDYDKVIDEDGVFTEEFEKFKKDVYRIGDYFKGHCKVSALIEYDEHPLKCSPTDLGKEKYLELYNNRENLYE